MSEDRNRPRSTADAMREMREMRGQGLATHGSMFDKLRESEVEPIRLRSPVLDLPSAEEIREVARERAGYSDTMVKALKRQLDPLLPTLKPDEEIGALLTSFGVSFAITVTSIGHEDPHLIIIKGVDQDGAEVSLFQHVSQVNILFRKIKVKPGKEPRRIGFF